MNYCRQSNDGLVCLRHLQAWPCPVFELQVQLRCAAVELAAEPHDARTALEHVERSLELVEAIAKRPVESTTAPYPEPVR